MRIRTVRFTFGATLDGRDVCIEALATSLPHYDTDPQKCVDFEWTVDRATYDDGLMTAVPVELLTDEVIESWRASAEEAAVDEAVARAEYEAEARAEARMERWEDR